MLRQERNPDFTTLMQSASFADLEMFNESLSDKTVQMTVVIVTELFFIPKYYIEPCA